MPDDEPATAEESYHRHLNLESLYALGKVLQAIRGLPKRERQLVLIRAQVLSDAGPEKAPAPSTLGEPMAKLPRPRPRPNIRGQQVILRHGGGY